MYPTASTLITISILCTLASFQHAHANTTNHNSAIQIVAQNKDTRTKFYGNAIPIGQNTFITNCHTLQGNHKVQTVEDYPKTYTSTWMLSSHDICILGDWNLEQLQLAPVNVGDHIRVVSIVGDIPQQYESQGVVLAINAKTIEVSAPWFVGVSGAAILNDKNELVGVATYISENASRERYMGVRWNTEDLNTLRKFFVNQVPRSGLYDGKQILNAEHP